MARKILRLTEEYKLKIYRINIYIYFAKKIHIYYGCLMHSILQMLCTILIRKTIDIGDVVM